MPASPSTVQPDASHAISHDTGPDGGLDGGLDDFAEFLADAYVDFTTACEEQGWVAEFVFHPAGHVLVIHDVLSGPVEVTDDGHPLPASPEDVDHWLLTSGVGTRRIPGSTPAAASVAAWVASVAVLMAAGR